jgi:hypothetical protein
MYGKKITNGMTKYNVRQMSWNYPAEKFSGIFFFKYFQAIPAFSLLFAYLAGSWKYQQEWIFYWIWLQVAWHRCLAYININMRIM